MHCKREELELRERSTHYAYTYLNFNVGGEKIVNCVKCKLALCKLWAESIELTVKEVLPPIDAAAIRRVENIEPVRSRANIDNKRSSESQNDTVNYGQSENEAQNREKNCDIAGSKTWDSGECKEGRN